MLCSVETLMKLSTITFSQSCITLLLCAVTLQRNMLRENNGNPQTQRIASDKNTTAYNRNFDQLFLRVQILHLY